MKSGDLVKPLMSCGGSPGAIRCKVAVVVKSFTMTCVDESRRETKEDWIKAVCPCGVVEEQTRFFEEYRVSNPQRPIEENENG